MGKITYLNFSVIIFILLKKLNFEKVFKKAVDEKDKVALYKTKSVRNCVFVVGQYVFLFFWFFEKRFQ